MTATPDAIEFRHWLATCLSGSTTPWPAQIAADTALDVIRREGVVALLAWRLAESPVLVPATVRDGLERAQQGQLAWSLLLTARCRQLLAALDATTIPVLLLKGSALAWWAYPAAHLRACSDIDLLFPSRAAAERARACFLALGCTERDGPTPGDLVTSGCTLLWAHGSAPAIEIDLHWQLSGMPLFAQRFDWAELEREAIALPPLAATARGLSPVHAYLHAALHRAGNLANRLPDSLKWLFDFELLGRRFTAADWQRVGALAIERGLAGSCLDAARASAACFGPRMPPALERRLDVTRGSEALDIRRIGNWWYVQRMNCASYPTVGLKLRWLQQRLWPERAYRTARYGREVGATGALWQRVRAACRRLRR
ncbi:MAG TPA: nucleotidyltransferase family protein [Rhodanobacteraceae bacterium]|nr:nucleotidyltransferase family protein [Rhodanobacteraceae bacterium]